MRRFDHYREYEHGRDRRHIGMLFVLVTPFAFWAAAGFAAWMLI